MKLHRRLARATAKRTIVDVLCSLHGIGERDLFTKLYMAAHGGERNDRAIDFDLRKFTSSRSQSEPNIPHYVKNCKIIATAPTSVRDKPEPYHRPRPPGRVLPQVNR